MKFSWNLAVRVIVLTFNIATLILIDYEEPNLNTLYYDFKCFVHGQPRKC